MQKEKIMLQGRYPSNNVNKSFIIFAIILFAGVITMIIGFANNNSLIIYPGLLITAAASFSMLFQAVISNGSKNFFYRKYRKD